MVDLLDRIGQGAADPRPSSDFDLNSDVILPPGRKLRPAAVLIGVLTDRSQPMVVLTKRSSALKHHPGQIAFPGGKVDADDHGVEGAALREAREEVGLLQAEAQIIRHLPAHETVTGFSVTPILAHLTRATPWVPERGEVDEVFEVPLTHVLDPGNFRVERRRWQGRVRHYYTVPFGPYYIWGATARILRALAEDAV